MLIPWHNTRKRYKLNNLYQALDNSFWTDFRNEKHWKWCAREKVTNDFWQVKNTGGRMFADPLGYMDQHVTPKFRIINRKDEKKKKKLTSDLGSLFY